MSGRQDPQQGSSSQLLSEMNANASAQQQQFEQSSQQRVENLRRTTEANLRRYEEDSGRLAELLRAWATAGGSGQNNEADYLKNEIIQMVGQIREYRPDFKFEEFKQRA